MSQEERKKLEEAAQAAKAAAAVAATKPWTDTPEAERDVAVLFPGQGTQKVGMAGKLLENSTVKSMFDLATKILGYSLVDLCAQRAVSTLTLPVCRPVLPAVY